MESNWTQKIGEFSESSDYDGLIAKSARTDSGNVVNLFSSGIKKCNLLTTSSFRLFYADQKLKKYSGKAKIALSHLVYDSKKHGEGPIEILAK